MNSIENYKKRFNMLMESSLGDVRPLIMETLEGEVIPITFQIPVTRDANNQIVMDTRGVVKFTAISSKGTDGESLAEYTKINSFALLGLNIASLPVSSMKQGQNIVGSFMLNPTTQKGLATFLWNKKGKDTKMDEDIKVDLTNTSNTRVRLYVSPTYTTYEAQAAKQPTQPK